MKIYTYANPFELNRSPELWDIITKYPHYCASDTLKQGIEAHYGRESFDYLGTVQNLIDLLIGDFINDTQLGVQLFLDISAYLREGNSEIILKELKKQGNSFPQKETVSAFIFNITDVVKSIVTLILLECDIDEFDIGEVSRDGRLLLEIYRKVKESPIYEKFCDVKNLEFESYYEKSSKIVNFEIEYLISDEISKFGKRESNIQNLEIEQSLLLLNQYEEYLNDEMMKPFFGSINEKNFSFNMKKVKHLKTIILERNPDKFRKIVIHGVHRFTPEMYLMIKLLEEIHVEVIFLINYAKNLPATYRTWKNVYDWFGKKYENEEELNLTYGSEIGRAMALVQEGIEVKIPNNFKVLKYNNLTSFTDREVRETFKNAGSLSKMKTQYYAIDGNSSNEILKMYFPDQFKSKPFLSYPIGQFILGIYRMWDFGKKELKFNSLDLAECATSRIYIEDTSRISIILDKVKLYFSDITYYSDYMNRIMELRRASDIVKNDYNYTSLSKISYLSIDEDELNTLEEFLSFLQSLSVKVLWSEKSTTSFSSHFKSLIDFLANQSSKLESFSKIESDLVLEISNRLSINSSIEVNGHVEDIKNALFYFLSARKKMDTSNWIVRDFEQIDGSIFLSNISKADTHHFALLSNSNVLCNANELLPWPLSLDMFNAYKGNNIGIKLIATTALERSNFLKFNLFYGSFFTKKNILFSYISEENGKNQDPYYLLSLLGADIVEYRPNRLMKIKVSEDCEEYRLSGIVPRNIKERELFEVCPYKYLLNTVLKAPIIYSSDYHIKYFVSIFMTRILYGIDSNSESDKKKMDVEFKSIRKIFPYWNSIVFEDVRKETKKQLEMKPRPNSVMRDDYIRRKENFLVAKWDDENGNNSMIFNKVDTEENIKRYMSSSNLYPKLDEMPNQKVCELCNFGNVCLRHYYEAKAFASGE